MAPADSGDSPLTVGVLGLGKLGLPLAYAFAEAGAKVLAWDVNKDARDVMRYLDEPMLRTLQSYHRQRIQVTTPDLISIEADVIFVIVPTPSMADGSFDASAVRRAIESVMATYAVICVVSTLSPGTCASFPEEWRAQLAYTPTFVALGSVVEDLKYPDVQLIGHSASRVAEVAANALRRVQPQAPHCYMTHASAEVAKLAVNAYVTMKITFANTIGYVCENFPGAHIDDVLHAVGADHRVGASYLTAGAGFGGPCFPRDNRALVRAADGGPQLAWDVDRVNHVHAGTLVGRALVAARRHRQGEGPLTYHVVGMAYKEGVAHEFESFGRELHDRFSASATPVSDLAQAEVVILALPLRNVLFHTGDAPASGRLRQGAVVVDCWRTHQYLAYDDVHYVPFGVGQEGKEERQ